MQIAIYYGDRNLGSYDLEQFHKEVISFGRQPDNDIVLDYDFISRVHGVFYQDNGSWCVEDLDSTNGVYMNGCKIKRQQLRTDDVVTISGKHSNDILEMIVHQPDRQESARKDTKKASQEKMISVRKLVEWIIAFVLIMFIVIEIGIPKYLEHKYDNDELSKLLVGTTMEIEDCNKHVVKFKVTSPDQIEITERKGPTWIGIFEYEYSVILDVDIGTGILQDVCADIKVPYLGAKKEVSWYYEKENFQNNDLDGKSKVKFKYTKEPVVTVGDIMKELGVFGSYQIMIVDTTCISQNYDAVEFCVIYRETGEQYAEVRQEWARMEYDYECDEWRWCQPVEKDKKSTLNVLLQESILEKGGFEADPKYTEDYVVIISPTFAEIGES